jgi:hypothetical protein
MLSLQDQVNIPATTLELTWNCISYTKIGQSCQADFDKYMYEGACHHSCNVTFQMKQTNCASSNSPFCDSSVEQLTTFNFSECVEHLATICPLLFAVLRDCSSRTETSAAHIATRSACLLKCHHFSNVSYFIHCQHCLVPI